VALSADGQDPDLRSSIATEGESSFFVSRTGSALSSRSIDLSVRRVVARARLELCAHVLRHTFVTGLVRAGNEIVLVAELAGHRRLETTRRYSLPSKADRQKAISDLEIEFDARRDPDPPASARSGSASSRRSTRPR
jgi:site-specific recombinase XerD